MPPGLVKQAQAQLRDQGLYPGAVDGIIGPKTRAALKAYQQKEGLPQTAHLDRRTVAKMNIVQSTEPPSRPETAPTSAPNEAPPNAAPAPNAEPNPPPSAPQPQQQ